ncbi:TPA: hypothetical protein LTB23_004145 [Escherichia coli]|nr:hypothetical protein [Escherichia coli]
MTKNKPDKVPGMSLDTEINMPPPGRAVKYHYRLINFKSGDAVWKKNCRIYAAEVKKSLLSLIVIRQDRRRIWLSPFSLRLTTGLYRVNT